ncbi:MAG: hypothetical protein LBG65_02725 [Puniceicoccales bacterium]|nr:hypothetical protein [Puniceicoccales bacterium]
MIVIFVLGYACIALEHSLHIDKAAMALALGAIMWVFLAVGKDAAFPFAAAEWAKYSKTFLDAHPGADVPSFIDWLTEVPLVHYLGEVAQILFFLLGAMAVVELIDIHGGFRVITDRIRTRKKIALLWLIGSITFCLSAVLDNLTTSIVMVALLRKLIADKQERWVFAGVIILAANAGGAWSPIGDVTTIMLWVANKFTSAAIIAKTILASVVSIVVPLGILSFFSKGEVRRPDEDSGENGTDATDGTDSHAGAPEPIEATPAQRLLVLTLGLAVLLFVPVFKALTHLPPYLGVLGGLSLLWIVTGFMHKSKVKGNENPLTVNSVLKRIDTPSVLFFLGILMAVNALQSGGQLSALSGVLNDVPLAGDNKYYLITVLIGILSSVVDNVPLVAGAMGMYAGEFPKNHWFWTFLAYCAGTGGSILIIGSAAGVMVMGMLKINFIWYLKRVSTLALVGYLAGAAAYIVQERIFPDRDAVVAPVESEHVAMKWDSAAAAGDHVRK